MHAAFERDISSLGKQVNHYADVKQDLHTLSSLNVYLMYFWNRLRNTNLSAILISLYLAHI